MVAKQQNIPDGKLSKLKTPLLVGGVLIAVILLMGILVYMTDKADSNVSESEVVNAALEENVPEQIEDLDSRASYYANLGGTTYAEGNYELAAEFYQKAVDTIETAPGWMVLGLADSYYGAGQIEEAKKFYTEARTIYFADLEVANNERAQSVPGIEEVIEYIQLQLNTLEGEGSE